MAEALRGLQLPAADSERVPELFNVREQTALAVDTFRSLGMIADAGAAYDSFRKKFEDFYSSIVKDPEPEKLSIEPFIGVQLSGRLTLQALREAFDKHQDRPSTIDESLWRKYKPSDLNQRWLDGISESSSSEGHKICGEALAMRVEGLTADPGGLHFRGVRNRRSAALIFGAAYEAAHQWTSIAILNPADYIIINAQRREAGRPLLDTDGPATSFIQLETRKTGGSPRAPRARIVNGQLQLTGASNVPGDGVRLALAVRS